MLCFRKIYGKLLCEVNLLKNALKFAGILLSALLIILLSYLLYVVVDYHRIEDNLALSPTGTAQDMVPTDYALSLITYNVGFGAYSSDYSFFMDGGEHARALSKEAVLQNTDGAITALQQAQPDFALLQEVDIDGTRSYHVDQTALFAQGFSAFDRVFAENYDSPYFLYPFHEPIGANRSGLLTLSRYGISSALRRSLPVENSLNKFLDLDRAYSVSVLPTDNGKNLLLYNVHLSAYTSDGTISADQLQMLAADMKSQADMGHYVIAAGDFNKDLLGDSSQYFERSEGTFNWATPLETHLLPAGFSVHTGQNAPTCRNADAPFRGDGTDFVLSVDGMLVSDNVEVMAVKTVDTRFAYSDHNPVQLHFVLKNTMEETNYD